MFVTRCLFLSVQLKIMIFAFDRIEETEEFERRSDKIGSEDIRVVPF